MLAAALALAPAPSEAIAPVLLLLAKQIARNVAESMIKDAILAGLEGMGCKGIALANALRALDLRRGGGGAVGMLGASGLPAGAANLAAMSGMSGLPKMPSMPATGAVPGMPSLQGMAGMSGLPGMPGQPGLGALSAGLPGGVGGAVPTDIMAKMTTLMPGVGQMPMGMGITPEQMAMLQQAMAEPLSPQETIATIDELADLGFLPRPIQSELKECMVVLPTSIAALGMGMGMLKPVVPMLRQARAELHALTPAEQDDIAVALADEIGPLPAAQRAEFVDYLGSGFFPPRVVAAVKARLGAR
ncbi:MAG: hypothetical protein ABIQ33_09845 [Caldimonas sp.]